MNIDELQSKQSEAGVISSLLFNPSLIYHSDELIPSHFSNKENGWIYWAVKELVNDGVNAIDVFNLSNMLNSDKGKKEKISEIPLEKLKEIFTYAEDVARTDENDYKVLVKEVLGMALKRATYKKLKDCERMCFTEDTEDLQGKIYSSIDKIMMDFNCINEVPEYKDIVRPIWERIKEEQKGNGGGIHFPFKELNKYVTIKKKELVVFGGEPKVGKSMFMTNILAKLLKNNTPTFYLDSEMNTDLFTKRLITHFADINFDDFERGNYSEEIAIKIDKIVDWLATRNFTHLYLPEWEIPTIYTAIKKVKHTHGIDVIIVDYFKSKSDTDAFGTYNELGRLTDFFKNTICGGMEIAGIAGAQATETGKLADSKKIARNSSTICLLQRKTDSEIATDGIECGDTKLKVVFNRNGRQMSTNEYIDLQFNGNRISYKDAKQHTVISPY